MRQFRANERLYVISKDVGIRQIRYLVETFFLAVIVGYRQHFLCCRPQNGANRGAQVADGERERCCAEEMIQNKSSRTMQLIMYSE